jgi:hypothetical protein
VPHSMCGSGVRWCDMHGKGIAISITYLKGDGPMRLKMFMWRMSDGNNMLAALTSVAY